MPLVSVILHDATLAALDTLVADLKKKKQAVGRQPTENEINKAVVLVKEQGIDEGIAYLYSILHPGKNNRVSRVSVMSDLIERGLGIGIARKTGKKEIPTDFETKWRGLLNIRMRMPPDKKKGAATKKAR